ncbi:MAG TPA: AMP-binding protein [Acidimicrobiia bacterium]|nr:AMP-binding protein [Acidimicrobiia bacterium]
MADQGLWANARNQPEQAAVVMGDATRTYGELAARASRLTTALAAAGVEPETPVAVMLPNGVEFFEVAAAAARGEMRFLPVNWHLKGEELAYILADSGARAIVADPALAEHVERGLEGAPGCSVLWVGESGSYEAAIADHEPRETEGWPAPAFMFYTSGTTGRPKGVKHGNMTAERLELTNAGVAGLWGLTADDVYLLSGPGYHAGPGGYAFATLFVGGTVAVLPAWDAREWLAAVERHRVTATFLAPAHFIRILEVPDDERDAFDLSSLRLIIHAGAPCPVSVKRRIIEALPSCEIWELYGMSEGGATRVSPQEWLERPGTVGKPWPGVEIRIVGPDGAVLGPNEPGVIYATPMGGAKFEYHNDPGKTSEAWRDDAYTVGDIGFLDDDGYLYLTDRASDMVIRGGVNIYPAEIENALHEHDDVVDCAVFGVPDERMGERLKAVVEARRPMTPDDVQDHVRERLADFKVPEIVEFVDQLPRDPNGKVMKRFLREQHWTAQGSQI